MDDQGMSNKNGAGEFETDGSNQIGGGTQSDIQIDNSNTGRVTPELYEQKTQKNNKRKIGLITAVVVCAAFIIAILVYRIQPASLSVTYDGDTVMDTVIDENNNGLHVELTNKAGNTSVLTSGYHVNSVTLKPDEKQTVVVTYKNVSASIEVTCSTSAAVSISVKYDGNTEEGTVIDENSPGLHVTVKLKNGSNEELTDGYTVTPVTLKADENSRVQVEYKDITGADVKSAIDVKCSTSVITDLQIEYTGSTEAGTVLDENNKGIIVKAKHKDGTITEENNWSVVKPETLKAEQKSSITIENAGIKGNLTVECTTIDKKKYKTITSIDGLKKGDKVCFIGFMPFDYYEMSDSCKMVIKDKNGSYVNNNDIVRVYMDDVSSMSHAHTYKIYAECVGDKPYDEDGVFADIKQPALKAKQIVDANDDDALYGPNSFFFGDNRYLDMITPLTSSLNAKYMGTLDSVSTTCYQYSISQDELENYIGMLQMHDFEITADDEYSNAYFISYQDMTCAIFIYTFSEPFDSVPAHTLLIVPDV